MIADRRRLSHFAAPEEHSAGVIISRKKNNVAGRDTAAFATRPGKVTTPLGTTAVVRTPTYSVMRPAHKMKSATELLSKVVRTVVVVDSFVSSALRNAPIKHEERSLSFTVADTWREGDKFGSWCEQ